MNGIDTETNTRTDLGAGSEPTQRKRLPFGLSPSRASDFKSCPQLFKFRSIDRLEEPPSAAAMRGSIVHLVLQRLFDQKPHERELTTALQILEETVREFEPEIALLGESFDGVQAPQAQPGANATGLPPEVEAIRFAAQEMIENYFDLEDPKLLEPIGREIRVRTEIDGLSVVGIIDRLDIDIDGNFVISDYKTGKTPPESKLREAFFGMRVYALLLSELEWAAKPPKLLRLIYLGSKETIQLDVDEAQLRATERTLTAIHQAIVTAYKRDDWRPMVGPLCDYCHFKPICPAHRGDVETAVPTGPEAI